MNLYPRWSGAYRALVRQQRRMFAGSAAFVVSSAAAEAFSLAVLGYAVTRESPTGEMLVSLSIVIGLSLGLSAMLRAAGERGVARGQIALERGLRDVLSSAILNSEWQDFVDQPGHELQSAVLAEAPQVATSAATFVRGIATLVAALVVFATAFVVSIPGATVCAVFAGIIGLAYNRATRNLGLAQQRLAEGTALITRHTAILVGGLRTLRLSPAQQAWKRDLDRSFDEQALARSSDVLIPIQARLFVELAGAAMIGGVLTVQTLATGEMLAGLVVMAMMMRVLPRLQAAQQALAYAKHGTVWIRRWNQRLEAISQHPLPSESTKLPTTNQVETALLEFDGISFRYRGHRLPVIQDLDLSVAPGEWICLVGTSGGGKSTLIDLLGGILRPSAGVIRVRGIDASRLDQDALHGEVAIVPQDIHLIGDTLESVLTWGHRLPRPERFDEICLQLGIKEMFLHSDVDFSSKLDELARDISGGMRTRLAIARALMSEPSVLVLDETTSRLHPAAEASIFEDIRRSMPDLAVLVVTHRYETARTVGNVLRLERGRLVASAATEI